MLPRLKEREWLANEERNIGKSVPRIKTAGLLSVRKPWLLSLAQAKSASTESGLVARWEIVDEIVHQGSAGRMLNSLLGDSLVQALQE